MLTVTVVVMVTGEILAPSNLLHPLSNEADGIVWNGAQNLSFILDSFFSCLHIGAIS